MKAVDLNEDDSLSMQMQIAEAANIRWDSLHLDSVTILAHDSMRRIFSQVHVPFLQGWNLFHQQYSGGYYRISIPLFNGAFTFCFLIIDFSFGVLNGERQVWFLKKTGDEWMIEQKITGSVR